MKINKDKKNLYSIPRNILFFALTLQIIIGGIRFSDGRILKQ